MKSLVWSLSGAHIQLKGGTHLRLTESEDVLTARKVWRIRRWVERRLATFSEIVVMAWDVGVPSV
jgi:hypothetical protein